MKASGKTSLEALDLKGMWGESFYGNQQSKANVLGVRLDSKKSRMQPWTVRPGQEWKMKIIGRGQTTGTPGHALTSYKVAIQEAKKAGAETVLLDKGVNRVLPESIKPNRRPDVTIQRTDGTIDQVEVMSKTDTEVRLKARMKDTNSLMPEHMRGNFEVQEIPGFNYDK